MLGIAPPFKTLSIAVAGAVFAAFQAGEVVAPQLPGHWGEVISVLIAALSGLGVFQFAQKWWERRQDKIDARERDELAELRRLRYDLQRLNGYAHQAYQAAVSAGAQLDPPPPLTSPFAEVLAPPIR